MFILLSSALETVVIVVVIEVVSPLALIYDVEETNVVKVESSWLIGGTVLRICIYIIDGKNKEFGSVSVSSRVLV